MKLDLGFGNSPAVRKAFLEVYEDYEIVFDHKSLSAFDYPERTGDLELVEMTRNVIFRQTGQLYNHIYLTNGATGGVVIALRAYRQRGYEWCVTRPAPYYARYPSMIDAAGMLHCNNHNNLDYDRPDVNLLDIPSNPLTLTTKMFPDNQMPVILDGVYLNNVYTNGDIKVPQHDVMVGSYSKLLGLNGIRIGWVATNDEFLSVRLRDLITGEYCGLSVASTDIIKYTIRHLDWGKYELLARFRLDCNREQWSKLIKYFGYGLVPSIGMFYYAPIDKKCKELLEKSNIEWTHGSSLGTNDNYGRFNLGQTNEIIEKAVKTIIKMDKSK